MNDLTELSGMNHGPIELGLAMVEGCVFGDLKESENPSEHFFADGIYGRATTASKDDVIVSQRHLQQHITVAIYGNCTVVDEQGNKTYVEAPGIWITEAGTIRSIYCHTDVKWLTVHANPKGISDVKEMEAEIAENPFTEYRNILEDQRDYPLMLEEIGFSAEDARAHSEREDDRVDVENKDFSIKLSIREGLGLFAERQFEPGDFIADARVGNLRTQAGRYTNHSKNPNGQFVLSESGAELVALKTIHPGEEITVNYRQAKDVAVAVNRRFLCP